MINRRRVSARAPSKKEGLLEAFQQKVDIEVQKSGLRSTGSLFLKEARDEHMRSITKHVEEGESNKTGPIPGKLQRYPFGGSSATPPSTPTSARQQGKRTPPPQLLRRPSLVQELMTQQPSMRDVRVGGVKLTVAELNMYEQMFSHYDKDKSGTIDRTELRLLLQELGRKVTDAEMATLMNELDKDGNGLIEFAEFLQGMDRLNQIFG